MSDSAGAAARRWGRRLRAWHRHVKLTVAMELATALHHNAQPAGPVVAGPREVEEQDKYEASRRQKAPPPGAHPGVLKEPEVQVRAATVGYVAAGAPSLSVVLVSDMMHDDTTVQYLLKQSSRQAELDRRKRRVEEEEKKAKEKKEKQKVATAKELVAVPGVGKWVELVDSGPISGTPKLTPHGGPCQAPHLLPLRQRGRRRRGGRGRLPKLLLLVLIVDSGSGMCQVGLSGVVPRAVFPSLVLLVTMHLVLCFLRLSRLLMKPVAIPQVQFLYKVICPL